MEMRPLVERRKQGEHSQKGEIKRKIITYIFDHPEGLKYDHIRDYLESKFHIREKSVVDDHLKYFEGKGLIIAPISNNSSLWKPIGDIGSIKKLWNDEIWSKATYNDLHDFLLTKQFQSIIKTTITPSLIELNYTQSSLRWNQMYKNLKNVASQEERKELESVCLWACQQSPILITHFFNKNKEVLRCIISSLDELLVLPEKGAIMPMVVPTFKDNICQSFGYTFNLVMEDWQEIRFSEKVSKELICILTIIICLFFESVKERDFAEKIFISEEFSKVWKLFLHYSHDLEILSSDVNADMFRIMFTMRFANSL
jgi:hypothetical protein